MRFTTIAQIQLKTPNRVVVNIEPDTFVAPGGR